jgi:predicted TIM-barrel fold metal-dependent hydrolase
VGHYSVYPSIVGPVVDKLQKAGKVLFIDYETAHWSSNAIEWDAVYQLCRAYPDIPVVILGSTITGTRNYPNLLADCGNLYLEISQIIQPEGIQQLVKKGYGKRLIFGSGFPLKDPAVLLNMLTYSDITQEELHDICSGNILRLMGIKYENVSFILKPPAKREIIDLHVHHGKINPVPTGTETAEGIVRNMERCGINASIVTSLWSYFGEVKRGNRAVSEACARYPGKLFGYLTLDPKYPKEIQNEFELYGDNPAFRGIKLVSAHGVDISDPRQDLIYSFADKKGWFFLCHASGDAAKWEKICNTYKNANFIVAHQGASDPNNPATVRLAELARKSTNLYLDCASSAMIPGALERLAAIAGADHLTYGSDYPMFDFSYETGRIFFSSLKEEEKELIFYGNARKLLKLK